MSNLDGSYISKFIKIDEYNLEEYVINGGGKRIDNYIFILDDHYSQSLPVLKIPIKTASGYIIGDIRDKVKTELQDVEYTPLGEILKSNTDIEATLSAMVLIKHSLNGLQEFISKTMQLVIGERMSKMLNLNFVDKAIFNSLLSYYVYQKFGMYDNPKDIANVALSKIIGDAIEVDELLGYVKEHHFDTLESLLKLLPEIDKLRVRIQKVDIDFVNNILIRAVYSNHSQYIIAGVDNFEYWVAIIYLYTKNIFYKRTELVYILNNFKKLIDIPEVNNNISFKIKEEFHL